MSLLLRGGGGTLSCEVGGHWQLGKLNQKLYPIIEQIKFCLTGKKHVLIEADRDRLSEILHIIIDFLINDGSRKITFRLSENEGAIHIGIDGGLIPGILVSDSYQKRMMIRRLTWINSRLSVKNQEDSAIIDLAIPLNPDHVLS